MLGRTCWNPLSCTQYLEFAQLTTIFGPFQLPKNASLPRQLCIEFAQLTTKQNNKNMRERERQKEKERDMATRRLAGPKHNSNSSNTHKDMTTIDDWLVVIEKLNSLYNSLSLQVSTIAHPHETQRWINLSGFAWATLCLVGQVQPSFARNRRIEQKETW